MVLRLVTRSAVQKTRGVAVALELEAFESLELEVVLHALAGGPFARSQYRFPGVKTVLFCDDRTCVGAALPAVIAIVSRWDEFPASRSGEGCGDLSAWPSSGGER